MPVENQGLQMRAIAKLGELAQGIQMVLAALPVGSDIANDVREALNKIAKHMRGMSKGPQITEAQLLAMERRQQGPSIAQLRALPGGGAPSGAPQPPPAA
jgi:hypothetical protein